MKFVRAHWRPASRVRGSAVPVSGRRSATGRLPAARRFPLAEQEPQPASAAQEILTGTTADPRHEFWPDDVPYTDVPTPGIIAHRQMTDAYLAQLARAHGSRLATFDQAMAKLHHDVAELVPDS